MYTIQANPSGTRSIEVSNENLRTIEKYALFRHLIDSTGIVDEAVLDKLKLNIRSLIASQEEDSKDLLDLCTESRPGLFLKPSLPVKSQPKYQDVPDLLSRKTPRDGDL